MPNTTASGVRGIDQILFGGLPKGSTIIVEGSPGTGKTTLGVQFLYYGALEYGEPGIYITFEEFPQQIYEDMQAFGWDLRELEKQNRLRVVSLKPELLLQQMKTPDGLFEQIIREIGCKRVVVDSISLLRYIHDKPEDTRESLYIMRNILRKHSLTALLLSERMASDDRSVPFEHYVADGVIHLALEEHLDKFRKRTLEITKMRGRRIVEGEHIYRITDQGIHLVPALTTVEDLTVPSEEVVSTGIVELDRMLSGGLPRGTACILDTNSKANFKYLFGSVISEILKQGNKMIAVPSSTSTMLDSQRLLSLYGVDLLEECRKGNAYYIDHYLRPVPAGFEGAVFNVKDMSNEEYLQFLKDRIAPLMAEHQRRGGKWFISYDLNTIYSQRGPEFVQRFFTEETAWAKAAGITIFALCNFSEVGEATASFLERTTNTVIRTWLDGNYQFLQLKKSINGNVSEPRIVETTLDKPYIRLV